VKDIIFFAAGLAFTVALPTVLTWTLAFFGIGGDGRRRKRVALSAVLGMSLVIIGNLTGGYSWQDLVGNCIAAGTLVFVLLVGLEVVFGWSRK
jgi:hypothetical protein